MSILSRYLLRTNLFLTMLTLTIGTGIYLLSDLFDRLDDFLGAGLGLKVILTYFAVKIPLIISQILPAVFLLSAVIQLCVMARDRELVALQAGGISFLRLARFFIIYALIWSAVQLGFSQVLGIYGEREASRIWKEQVRNREIDDVQLTNLWFTEHGRIIHLETLHPAAQKGSGITVYELTPDELSVQRVIRGKSFRADSSGWTLDGCDILIPGSYEVAASESIVLPIEQDVKAFSIVDPRGDPSRLPLWQLQDAIARLTESGSNVEALRTAWHMKLSYAFSLVTMALLALALITWRDSIYINVGTSLLLVFVFYTLFTVGGSLGENGIVPPLFAAWTANAFFSLSAIARLIYVSRARAA
ncbi:LPS export ABC transporter permease LptG [Oleidesulfovibrio alaskensis]|uniref:LPS export ABC transporter permease LptG n=1 Tax=Oleidesulfovibrio alaskensis TaxID=58180 RepID=UPI00040AB79A|nr:LPS export ABC transporter permease LptG [Oleidesulfovibrio alaskensis]